MPTSLEQRIIEANVAYQAGHPTMSDAAFDALLAQLPEGHALHQYLGHRGTASIQHAPKMLSLGKAKTVAEVHSWAADHPDELNVMVMPKLDGVACRLIYVMGQFVGAYTRGDGTTGEDITHVVVHLLSIPKESPFPKISGELVIDKESFAKLKESTTYTIARSAVVGLISRKDSLAAATAGVRFIAYDAHTTKGSNAPDSLFKRLQQLQQAGFVTALVYHQCPLKDLSGMLLESCRKMVANGGVDTDGIVVRIDSVSAFKNAGANEHHPNGAIALKHPNENVTTTIANVRWQVGRTGAITPVVDVKPVVVEGAEISRATLHNVKMFRDCAPNRGASVELKRSGGVIPFIVSVTNSERGKSFAIPEECPSCGGELSDNGTQLVCVTASNRSEDCFDAAVAALLHFVGVLNIDGIGQVVAEHLVRKGYIRGPDIYPAFRKKVLVEEIGEKVSATILDEVEAKRELPLSVVLEACGMDEIGKTHAKNIALKCPATDAQGVLAYFDALDWAEGFGAVRSAQMRTGYQKRRHIFELALRRIKLKFAKMGSTALLGKGFCFTGDIDIPRTQAESYVEDLGGIVQSTVSKKTNYLVCGDADSGSAKAKKARELQQKNHPIRILTGPEFLEMVKAVRRGDHDSAS